MECYALREWIAPELIIETGSSEFGKTAGRLGVDNNQLKPIAGDSFAKIEGKLFFFLFVQNNQTLGARVVSLILSKGDVIVRDQISEEIQI